MQQFRDFLGRELKVGDAVVFTCRDSQALWQARIHHFDKKKVRLDTIVMAGEMYPIDDCSSIYKPISRYPHQLAKVEVYDAQD